MTTTTRNEAAEQVLAAVQIGISLDWEIALDAALAAERRATVERLSNKAYAVVLRDDVQWLRWDDFTAALDEERKR